jgi:hypothetical protein
VNPVDYARLAAQSYHDVPTIGDVNSASRMHVYGDVHCFRGSDDILAWLHDADCRPLTVVGFGKVHSGFWHALSAILPACLALPRPTAIAGHSLGAAMAILYGAVLARLGSIVPVYAFEPPHVCFDGTLGQFLNATRVPVYATRNGNDVVPDIPLGLTLPASLTPIGKPMLPFDNIQDHSITRVVEALAA